MCVAFQVRAMRPEDDTVVISLGGKGLYYKSHLAVKIIV